MAFKSFFEDFYSNLSSVGDERIFLFMTGKGMGKKLPDVYFNCGAEGCITNDMDIAHLINIFKIKEIGNIKLKKADARKKEFIFTLADSAFRTNLNKPSCHVVSGMLAGLVEKTYNKYAGAREVKCVSKGDKNCEFQVKVVGQERLS